MLAMAPPVPLGGKIFISFMAWIFIGMLLRLTRGQTVTPSSATVALAASVLIVVVLESAIPRSPSNWLHNLGFLAGLAGALCATLFFRPQQQVTARSSSTRTALLALVVGPLIGLIIATLSILSGNVSPLDRGYTFGVCIGVGLLAGLIGAGLVAVSSLAVK